MGTDIGSILANPEQQPIAAVRGTWEMFEYPANRAFRSS